MAAQGQKQPRAKAVNTASSDGALLLSSLYVGDLDINVTDSQLYDLFGQMGEVVSTRVCMDLTTRSSLGYGYVNYRNPRDAERALVELNSTPLDGKPIRIMNFPGGDPAIRRSGAGTIFIKNLAKDIDRKDLYEILSSFGSILLCKVARNSSGQSLGYGIVQYASEESALKAIEKLNGAPVNGKQVYVGPFVCKKEREMLIDKTEFTNVFVKNLSESITEEYLQEIFGEFGSTTSTVVMRNEDGTSKCFGFVNFENADDAARAVESLNGKKFDNKEWYVGRAQKKSERELELKQRIEQSVKESDDKSQGSSLYVKNLDDSVSDDMLKDLFSPFGSITSCKVLRDPKGISRGSGFVAFKSPEEASRALWEMNGKMIVNKPLYVALAQRKEDRKDGCRTQYAQMRQIPLATTVTPLIPMYTPGGPGLGQHIFYGQPPAIIPPQAGFGYQQQLVPGMRPTGPLLPNMFVPLVQQGRQGPCPRGRRANTVPLQQGLQPVPIMQQQMLPRGCAYRYPPGHGMPDTSLQGLAGGILSAPLEMGGWPLRDAGMSLPIPIGALASALANASPPEQRAMLAKNLYPLVEQLEPETTAKVTGMLLEMEQTEVLHLLDSPEALKAKVAEAMDVLRNVSQQSASSPAEQLASSLLN